MDRAAPCDEPIASLALPSRRGAGIPLAQRLVWAWAGVWFLYLVLAPTTGFGWIDSWHNEQRMGEIALLTMGVPVLLAAALDATVRRALPRPPATLAAIFLIGVISASCTVFREAAYAEVSLYLLLAAMTALFAATVSLDLAAAARAARRGALILLVLYLSGVAVRYAAALWIRQPLNLDVLLVGYDNPRFPSAMHALLFPFVASLALDKGEARLLRHAAAGALALAWASNLALGTRAIWFAYVVTFALLFATPLRRQLRGLARVMTGTAICGLGLYWLLFRWLPAWTGIGDAFTDRNLQQLIWGTNRELLIASSWEAIRTAPWLGLGPMQFAAIPKVWAAHPHNWVLQLASEWGIPATLLALWGLTRLARRVLAATQSQAAAAPLDPLPAQFAAVVALVYGLVDGNLVMPVSQATAAIVFGLLVGQLQAPDETAAPGVRTIWRAGSAWIACALILVAAAAQLAWYGATTVQAATALEAPQHIYATRVLWPRFWSDGLLPPGRK